MGVLFATIGGGEPTLRKDLPEIVHAFSSAGLEVQLTTNGLALSRDLRFRLYEAGLTRLTFSIDSHLPEVYARVRGVDRLQKVLDTLDATLAERPPSVSIESNSVLCSANATTFLATIDFLLAKGVDSLAFSAATTSPKNFLFAEDKGHLFPIPPAVAHQIVQGLLERKQRDPRISPSSRFIRGLDSYLSTPSRLVFPCLAGYLTLDVFADGTVYGCGNLPPIGHVRTASLFDIWRSDAASSNRRAMAEGRCPGCYLSCKVEPSLAAHPRFLPEFAWERLRGLLR